MKRIRFSALLFLCPLALLPCGGALGGEVPYPLSFPGRLCGSRALHRRPGMRSPESQIPSRRLRQLHRRRLSLEEDGYV
jgi:hypothetical protein